jgi:hypothetical protein
MCQTVRFDIAAVWALLVWKGCFGLPTAAIFTIPMHGRVFPMAAPAIGKDLFGVWKPVHLKWKNLEADHSLRIGQSWQHGRVMSWYSGM